VLERMEWLGTVLGTLVLASAKAAVVDRALRRWGFSHPSSIYFSTVKWRSSSVPASSVLSYTWYL